MADNTRVRAKARHFGPETPPVTERVISRVEATIRMKRRMVPDEIAALLGDLRQPHADAARRAKDVEDGGP